MEQSIKRIDVISVTGQIEQSDLPLFGRVGFAGVICNRHSHEGGPEQRPHRDATGRAGPGAEFAYLPVLTTGATPEQAQQLRQLLSELPKPVLAYCRTGNRSSKLFEAATQGTREARQYDVVVVGGGSGGISVSASLLKRSAALRIAVIEPSTEHYYQPAWTLVGGGAATISKTRCAPPLR